MKPSRRDWMAAASGIGMNAAFGPQLGWAKPTADVSRPFKRCVVLWMEGGPSHVDTFVPSKDLGQTTSVPGLALGPAVRDMSGFAEDLCVVKSIGSREGEHTRAVSLLHTGFSPSPSFPRPSFGSMVSDTHNDPGFPRYVTLGQAGFGPAFLGPSNGPFIINDAVTARQQIDQLSRRGTGMQLLHELNQMHRRHAIPAVAVASEQRNASIESVRRLLSTDFGHALDASNASVSQLNAFGGSDFGQRMLVARRLLDLGVPIVEVQLGGWDTHVDNDRRVGQLTKQLVPAWQAMITDLKLSGLWDDTLIVWLGEFGRTPASNGGGRDHYPEIIPVVLAGGNLGGNVIGSTNDSASQRSGPKHSVADLMATLLALLGCDIQKEYTTSFGSPTTVTDEGTPIAEILQLVG